MLRRLAPNQPENFAFTPANLAWAEGQISKYPEGRQASAIIPLLWRAQEQEGWLSRPAIEEVARMLDLAYIRALEVATFYFMFQLHPVGSVAHIQICGTTTCMICGAEDLVAVCQEKIAAKPFMLSDDGKFSWEEVECLGACANAPMAQIGKDYFEDLTAENFGAILDKLAAGTVPKPGPQNGRYAAEPLGGLTSLTAYAKPDNPNNASVGLAVELGDTVKRIDGTEVPLLTPWRGVEVKAPKTTAKPKPAAKAAATDGGQDDLKLLKGVGPKLEQKLHANGVTSFAQVAAWGPKDIADMDDKLSFKGRIARDGWVEQAKLLAEGGETEFSKRAKKADIYET